MKKEFVISFLMILIIGCSETKPYYENPIKNWLSKNLNDYSSYEPIEFTVLSINNDLFTPSDLFGVQNVVQRKINIVQDLIIEIKKIDGINMPELTSISGYSQNLSALNSQSNYSIISIDSINNLLDKAYEVQKNKITSIHKTEILNLSAQYEGTSNRYQVEIKNVTKHLLSIGTDLKNCDYDIQNGLFIIHKFRAKNSFGALVINTILFKLDNEKKTVLNTCDKK
jgi:hypothetical protein